MDRQVAEALRDTWPAGSVCNIGGLRMAMSDGGGDRVNSAHSAGEWQDADIAQVARAYRDAGRSPLFQVRDDDARLSDRLSEMGFGPSRGTAVLSVMAQDLTDREIPPVTAFAMWPPLAIQRDIWRAAGIDAGRQEVMARVGLPKAAILGRIEDRAAGAAFVAQSAGVAVVHALEITASLRRKGLAGWMMRRAAIWACENGADRLVLAVMRDNDAALALYRGLGFREIGGYSYYGPDQDRARHD